MKLLLAIVEDDLAFEVAKELSEKGIRSTKLSSSGGFLKKGNTTLLVGIQDEQVDTTVATIRETIAKNPTEDPDGNEFAANIFILPISAYEQM